MENNLKFDWYQTDTDVFINIYLKKLAEADLKLNLREETIDLVVEKPDTPRVEKFFNLTHQIVTESSTHKILSTKIEIKLRKKTGNFWSKLEKSADEVQMAGATEAERPPAYPSSCPKKKDWEGIERQVKKDEAEEKPEGDAALNQLFQKIYADGSDEVRKAMNKSFQESGGTVLSTNWNEIAAKKTEIKAPDGMEWKKYDQ